MTTAVPKPVFAVTGYVAPAEPAILEGVKADMQTAFGGRLNFTTVVGAVINATPQSQWASSLTAITGNVYDTFAFLTQMFDPAFNYGRYQDAIGRIYFIERNPSQPTVVQVLCTGLAGTVIPQGATALDTAGNVYVATATGTIGVNGNVTIAFANLVPGPIPCAADTLNRIFRTVIGLDTINNPAPGVMGINVESRVDFEARRSESVAKNSMGQLASVRGAVLDVDGVIDAFAAENDDNVSTMIGGVTLAPNSIYIAATGGVAQDIGDAIITKKAPGAAYNGNTTVTVYDTEGYDPPYPQYTVKFEIPDNLPIVFSVVLGNGPDVPADAQTQVALAITQAFVGLDGGRRERIGRKVYASRYYAPVAALGAWVRIISITVGSANMEQGIVVGDISGNTLTVSSVTSGSVTIGSILFDAAGNIGDGTTVTGYGTGSGGVGTYVVDTAQTVGSETITAVSPGAQTAGVHIDQFPVTDVNLIKLSLA